MKQKLDPGLVLKTFHRIIKFTQIVWLKPYILIWLQMRKTWLQSEKDFFELMNNEFFRKTIKNLKKHRDIKLIKLVTTETRRNYLVSEPNYNATISSSENLLLVEIKIPKCTWINNLNKKSV